MSELDEDKGREMSLERLKTLLEAYGASPARWPHDERAQMEAFIHANANSSHLVREALALDRALDAAPAATMNGALSARILDSFDRVASRPSIRRLIRVVADTVWPGAPAWQPSAALAASLIVGMILGVMLPLGSQAQGGQTTDVSADFSPSAADNDREP